jgi:hypothetical protein
MRLSRKALAVAHEYAWQKQATILPEISYARLYKDVLACTIQAHHMITRFYERRRRIESRSAIFHRAIADADVTIFGDEDCHLVHGAQMPWVYILEPTKGARQFRFGAL